MLARQTAETTRLEEKQSSHLEHLKSCQNRLYHRKVSKQLLSLEKS